MIKEWKLGRREKFRELVLWAPRSLWRVLSCSLIRRHRCAAIASTRSHEPRDI